MKATTPRSARNNKENLSPEQREQILSALKARFEKNRDRHKGVAWFKCKQRSNS